MPYTRFDYNPQIFLPALTVLAIAKLGRNALKLKQSTNANNNTLAIYPFFLSAFFLQGRFCPLFLPPFSNFLFN